MTAQQQVTLVSRQLVEGMVTRDYDLLKKIITPQAQFGHVTGASQTRDEWLRQIKQGRMRYFANVEETMAVTVNGDRAQTISRNRLTARIYGFEDTWPLETTATLAKIDGTWQITASQASLY